MLDIFKKAQENKYAVGQFNVSNWEQIRAVVQAASKLKSPVIIGTSEGEGDFVGRKQIAAVIDVWRKETGLPILLHQDHGRSFEVIEEAIEAGYDSVHFDGSKLSFEENAEATKKAVDFARERGIENIEGELGYLRGKSAVQEIFEIKEEDLTDPNQAKKFVEKTGVDSLAVVIGNLHGIFKSVENPRLNLDRLKQIKEQISDTFLVLHGGSGISEEDIRQAIEAGIVKVNVNTELRIAYRQSLGKSLADNPEEITPYRIMPPVVEAVQKIVERKIKLFGSDNRL